MKRTCASVARTGASSTAPHADIHAHRILILDFGAQYTQLIARRVRELGVYCEIHPWDITDDEVRAFKPRGVILSGGPESVTDAQAAESASTSVFTLGVPVLGICYGMQTMAQQLGGRVVRIHRARVRLCGSHGQRRMSKLLTTSRIVATAKAAPCWTSG